MLVIGLTGGIGSGKSTIAKIIETLGYPVYISDRRASELINEKREIKEAFIHHFGEDIYLADGKLDKKKLAAIIFHDREAISTVNKIVHPIVLQDFAKWCSRQSNFLLFFESAILFEARLNSIFDRIVTITADRETRIKRVMNRDNTTREKVVERIENQMPDSEKVAKSDFVIYNNEDSRVLKQVLEIINQLNEIRRNKQ